MPPVTQEALVALGIKNHPPRLFVVGDLLTRIRSNDTGIKTEELDVDSLRGHLARSARWAISKGFDRDKNPVLIATPPPKHIVRDILSLPAWPTETLPPLEGVVGCPYFARDGSLIDKPGYHPDSKLFYEPPPGFALRPVPTHPTAQDITVAKALLLDEYLDNFPLKTQSDRANALGFMLTLLVRNLIDGPVPFVLIEAPVMGTGKSKLAECLLIPAVGVPKTTAQPATDEEWRKNITASLVGAPQAIWYDNLKGSLKSQALEQVLTSTVWEDRNLGETRILTLPVRCGWLGTANNLQLLGDLLRRFVLIKLDARMERPWERDASEFKHPLPEWGHEHRTDLLWAALVLIRAWVARGRPPGSQSLASYESWSKTIGGILQVAGIDGFLEEQKTRHIDADDFSGQMEDFLHSIHQRLGNADFGVNDLQWVVDSENEDYDGELLQGLLGKETKSERAKALGWVLKKNTDRVFGRYQLVLAGRETRGNRRRYNVVELDRPAPQVAKWKPEWDDQTARINPLVLGPADVNDSRRFCVNGPESLRSY